MTARAATGQGSATARGGRTPSEPRLADKVALVTGGGAGIGRAISVRFAAEGATVIVCDLDADGAAQTLRLVRQVGGGLSHDWHHLDVSDESGWEAIIETVLGSHGRLDVLVNNAARPYRRLLPESTWEAWQALMAVNAGGTFLGMKHSVRALTESNSGAVVNISSAAALVGVTGMTSYSAGKGAIRAMSRTAAIELASAGIRVNSVYPTSVATAMVESDARDTGVSVPEFLDAAAALSPLPGMAETTDVANAALFLASDESRFVTGAELVVDGGATTGVG